MTQNNKGKWKAAKYMQMTNCAIENARKSDVKPNDRWLNQNGSRVYKLAQSIIDSSSHNPGN